MRVLSFISAGLLCYLCCWAPVLAQSRDEGRRSGRGGGESDRGGFDRGRGGFGGGGGFPGGGGFGGGGFPGGGRGGGPGGGFNPADMIRRFDRNGNNMIDPDEAQGPAQFFLQRMAQNNPKIDLSKPVPIDLLTGEMDRMRGGRGDSEEEMATEGPSLMVPDFSLPSTPTPVPGFGASSSKFTVKVEERDIKEAEERLRRYDENRDGFLSADELRRGRWPDDPMQYDRNRDGKLSANELAVRYANQRIQEAERNANNNGSNGRGQRNDNGWVRSNGREEEAKEEESRFGDAKSYRLLTRKETVSSVKGLPDFFARSDADGDGQVLMSEFSSSWNEETLTEFLKWDLNNDGIITVRECLAAVANGARGATSSSASSSSASASAASAGASQPAAGTPDAAQMEWAARQIAKYDTNGDKQLTANEWEKMIIKPDGADLNGDGAITVEEYAAFRAKKK